MNKKIGLIAASLFASLLSGVENGACDCKASSHSFFSIHPVFTVISPEYLVHSRDFYKAYSHGRCSTFQATLLGGKSTKNENLARFFNPTCKTVLNVNEQQLANTDILASQLNIYTVDGTFASTVEFKPRHSYIGVGLNYQQRFYETCNGNGIWLSVSGPVLRVKNKVEIVENITNTGGGAITAPTLTPVIGGCPAVCPNSCNTDCLVDPMQALQPVASVAAAFAQPSWCFGRIDNNHHTKTRLGDLTVRVGYETVNKEDVHADSFIGAIIPTGNKPKAIEVFEPIVGHNHHWGVILGGNVGMEVWQSCESDTTICSELDFAITYLFQRKERRSFDLKGKPWSRYMQFYSSAAQAQLAATTLNPTVALTLHTPGIDILTQDLKVKPGYYGMFNGAIVLNRACFELEVGGNVFARQAECVHFGDCGFPTGAALKDIAVGGGQTGLFQTINNDFGNNCTGTTVVNFDNNLITADDVDLGSAAHPATITSTMYGSLAYTFNSSCDYPMFVAAGGSYEFSPDNVGLNRWMAWGKFGVAF